MKKVLSIIVVLLLALVLVGCDDLSYTTTYEQNKDIIENLNEIKINVNEITYTQEEIDLIVDVLIKEIVELKYDDTLDVEYNQETNIFKIIEYDNQGNVFDVDEYTIQDVIDTILAQK
jgi:PBP1b-binding outer membrane lipoprotein LpoB